MAIGTWEDFNEKYGFSDGEGLEDRDFRARKILVKMLNERPEMKKEDLVAIEYDRPGMHNACLALIFARKDLGLKKGEKISKAKLMQRAENQDIKESALPEFDGEEIVQDLIDKAYSQAR